LAGERCAAAAPEGRAVSIAWPAVRDAVLFVTLVINLASMAAMVAGILMHSGRGGGLSDMFGGGSGAALGSSSAERNLTRITTCFAMVWLMSVIALSFLFVRT
jgi:preprotein translocase subunit SecG